MYGVIHRPFWQNSKRGYEKLLGRYCSKLVMLWATVQLPHNMSCASGQAVKYGIRMCYAQKGTDYDLISSQFQEVKNKHSIRYVRYIRSTLIVSIETCKEVASTSFNLIQEAFIRRDEELTWRGLVFVVERDLTPLVIKDELWRLIFTPLLEVDWSMISVM